MQRTWLESLSSHSIFNDINNSNHHQATDAEKLPPSPGLSTVNSFNGDDSLYNTSNAHPSTSKLPKTSSKRSITCLIRKTELLVAVGSSIRLGDLAHFKTRVEAVEEGSGLADELSILNGDHSYAHTDSLGSFKTLYTPAIDFEIVALVPSPSSRYVAAVGASQIVVVQIPRKGWHSLVGRTLECSHDPVGPFYHSPSSETIAQVSFHPWGVEDSTLLVLTSDGLLREYDLLDDPEEPTQFIDFTQTNRGSLPPAAETSQKGIRYGLSHTPSFSRRDRQSSSTPSRRRSRSRSRTRSRSRSYATPGPAESSRYNKKNAFGVARDDDSTAVSFCFGKGDSDWSSFTLYCMMQTGDLFCVCPYLPKTADLPTLLLDSLLALTSAKLNHLASSDSSATLSLYESRELEAEYTSQLKFLNALTAYRIPTTGKVLGDESVDYEEDSVRVKYPSYLRNQPTRQGPFLLQPAPLELDIDEDEPAASSLAYVLIEDDASEEVDALTPPVGLILMAYRNGKVDICIDTSKVEASWIQVDRDAALPSLLVYESVDLFGPNSCADSPVQLLQDPEYADEVYAQHDFGLHAISLRPVYETLIKVSSAEEGKETAAFEHPQQASATWLVKESMVLGEDASDDAVVGVAVVNDVYLGYAVIVLHANMHVTGIELALRSERIGEEGDETSQSMLPSGVNQVAVVEDKSAKAYVAFAGVTDFQLPSLLTRNGSTQRLSTRYASPPPSSSRGARATKDAQPRMELTVETLRFVGSTIEGLDKSIRDLISAANIVQDRLGLHLAEIPRQVEKLITVDDELVSWKEEVGSSFEDRLEQVKQRQQNLSSKADRILQRLIDSSQPELSVYEKRWIEELERVQDVVGDISDRKSLESRAERLREQLNVLRPGLEHMREVKTEQRQGRSNKERLGEAQKKRVESALAEESRLVSEARARIERIQKKIQASGRAGGGVVGR